MIDPVSAFALATGAFNMIKKAVEAGREIEDCVGYFGKFFQGVSDINKAEEEANGVHLFHPMLCKPSKDTTNNRSYGHPHPETTFALVG